MLAAVVYTLLSARKHMVDIDEREHDQSADERPGLDKDAAPEKGGVSSLVKQGPDDHLQPPDIVPLSPAQNRGKRRTPGSCLGRTRVARLNTRRRNLQSYAKQVPALSVRSGADVIF
uniref:Uncharacterized protein n=1 Tax=Periophthalmus magnuspinnatus TaxID=409849 RepID=A0A3B4BMY6_9GOBI